MATVQIIWPGYFRWVEKHKSADVTANSVLIESNGEKIIVDVPNVGEEAAYLEALAKAGVDPLEVRKVIVTHEHPDHVGCLHLFPNAWYYASRAKWKGARHEYLNEDELPIADGVRLIKTPGHTPNDGTVFADTDDGVVAMAGDLWVWSVDDPRNRIILDHEKIRASRELVAKRAKWIIPGHGPMQPSSKAVY